MPPLTEELGLVRASAMAIINSGTITDEQRHTLSAKLIQSRKISQQSITMKRCL